MQERSVFLVEKMEEEYLTKYAPQILKCVGSWEEADNIAEELAEGHSKNEWCTKTHFRIREIPMNKDLSKEPGLIGQSGGIGQKAIAAQRMSCDVRLDVMRRRVTYLLQANKMWIVTEECGCCNHHDIKIVGCFEDLHGAEVYAKHCKQLAEKAKTHYIGFVDEKTYSLHAVPFGRT